MIKFLYCICIAMMLGLVTPDLSGPSMPQGAVSEPAEFHDPPPLNAPSRADIRRALLRPMSVRPLSPAFITPEILWLARAMYSETKRPHEQELVAWVVRNRLESRYLGAKSIQDVVTAPYQFSAFNPGSPVADFLSNLGVLQQEPKWQRTLGLAYFVAHADTSLRPFAPTVRHFYSLRSMTAPKAPPVWAMDREPVEHNRAFELEADRFRFFADVD